MRKVYQQNDGKLAQARYRKTDKAKARTKKFLNTEKGKKYNNDKSARWREKYPERAIAHRIANKYLPDKPCGIEGCDVVAEKHHDNHKNPLDVKYLCKEYHMELHWGVSESHTSITLNRRL